MDTPAETTALQTRLTDLTDLTDPVSLHHRPPFPEQDQDHPGSTEAMDPRPDHGEDTVFLASDQASYITGEIVNAIGGTPLP